MNKKLYIWSVIAMIWTSSIIHAQQNLVPNPSFEDTINCPYQFGDIDKANAWITLCGSPDYFKSCNHYDWGVPANIFGYQASASGNSYSGFISYSTAAPNMREFPACNLSAPLNIGTKYYVSFKIALSLENVANPTNCASNKIGARFATNSYFCDALINNNPPVYSDSIVTDSINWTRIKGSFVADSAYTYLVIGNFFDDTNTDTVKYFSSWWDDFAYYYLDDVCLGTDSAFVYGYNGITGLLQNRTNPIVSFYPNPVEDFLFVQSNFNKAVNISIYNLLGKQLLNISQTSSKSFSVNLSSIPSGMFIINFKTSDQSSSYKLQKL